MDYPYDEELFAYLKSMRSTTIVDLKTQSLKYFSTQNPELHSSVQIKQISYSHKIENA